MHFIMTFITDYLFMNCQLCSWKIFRARLHLVPCKLYMITLLFYRLTFGYIKILNTS